MGKIVAINPRRPEPDVIRMVVEHLRRGDVVAGPSDTVYGFLAVADSRTALSALQRLKSRQGPFLHLMKNTESVEACCLPLDLDLREKLGQIWPGPVTVVLPVADSTRGVAFRVPENRWLSCLLDALAGPLLSSSANVHGDPPPQFAVEVVSRFPALPLIIDGGKAPSTCPSTLVDARNRPCKVLREGSGDATPLLRVP